MSLAGLAMVASAVAIAAVADPCEVAVKTANARTDTGPKLPPPPAWLEEDLVNDLGWLSRGPHRRAERWAERWLAPMLLRDGEPSGLPPDPEEPPPLTDPLDEE